MVTVAKNVAKLSEKQLEKPETGIGILEPIFKVEAVFNNIVKKLPWISAVLISIITILITLDVSGRIFFNRPLVGIFELELLCMCLVGYFALAYPVIKRENMQIDLFFNYFSEKTQRGIYFYSTILCASISLVLAWRVSLATMSWTKDSGVLEIPEWPFMAVTAFGLAMAGIAFFFQLCHSLKSLLKRKEILTIVVVLLLAVATAYLPFFYKSLGFKISGLAIGGIAFLILMVVMLLRVPLGFAMGAIGLLGMIAIVKRPEMALINVSSMPFTHVLSTTMIAFPMFMLMGEMVSLAGLSNDLFDAAKKWMGRLPGGLAVASVGGCAGFGAVCGDSMATVITMSTVAMPAMQKNNYDNSLSTGALAAGGTLGILIPPSMGFIIYSMVTEVSVGKLFVAGIFPGILLCSIFMMIITIKVKLNPSLAPICEKYTLKEKMTSLIYIIPVIVLFTVVVVGILYGFFTPAEGGAIGAALSFLYAVARKKVTFATFKQVMYHSGGMFGKFFTMFIGLAILGGFLSASRLPYLLSDFIVGMQVNAYIVIAAIVVLYIFLGCVMNIMPMMLLTLPSIFPTVQALGFDGVWFGVICVIVMEMGMITPPVGMNVFTLASLQPNIPMSTIFRGVLPFFFGMLLCVAIIIVFPQIALFLL